LGEVNGDKGRQHCESHDNKWDNDVEADVKAWQISDFFQGPSHHFAFFIQKCAIISQVQRNRRHCAEAYSRAPHKRFQTCHAIGVTCPPMA
jgi:hypothetical protein